ncbi:MAG: ribonuclease III [Chloroflexota bacterium]
MTEIAELEQLLGVALQDKTLLELALVHSSYLNENPTFAPASNERLEFLGDAVLGLIIAEKLYQDFPALSEGEMTKLRAALVRRETLAMVAETLELGAYLYLGRGEEAGGGRHNTANLAATLEAVVAAVFLDRGMETARGLVLRLFGPEIEKTMSQGARLDYKSALQEAIQARYQQTPHYSLLEVTGPDHDRRFTVAVMLGSRVLGKGAGRNKRAAETEAARVALEELGKAEPLP